MSSTLAICEKAKGSAPKIARLASETKDAALHAMADALEKGVDGLAAANQEDVHRAKGNQASATVVDRLTLTDSRIGSMAEGLRAVAAQPDPVGEVIERWSRPNGLLIEKVRAPLGVVAVIYEARPNVTADVAGLCLKSGNACVLRGSSIAISSNTAIAGLLQEAAESVGVPRDAIGLIADTGRDSALALMKAKGLVDLLIPRGGKELIRSIEENAQVPYLIDGDGNCHVYVDAAANLDMARAITLNAKTQRPSVCNAAETLLVHRDIAEKWLPETLDALTALGVEIRGDEDVTKIFPQAKKATTGDWETEYLELILAVKVVDSLEGAICHINEWGTSNAEAIVTEDLSAARRFAAEVDSGSVFVNASTRFSDGSEFGYGAEIGISTQKLHARGPMGLRELTSAKYVVWGKGQTRD